MKPLEIDLQTLPYGRSSLQLEVPACELDIAPEQYWFHDNLTVEVEVVRGEREITVSGWLTARAKAECSRCLKRFEESPRIPLSLVCHISPHESVPPEEAGGEDTTRFLPSNAVRLDLTEDVRSALILDLPLRPLCREDCPGLCPQCGRDLNEGACGCTPKTGDPRWEALKNLHRPGD